MNVDIDFGDLDQLERDLDAAERKVSTLTPALVLAASQRLFADAVANAQQMADTGELARSVRIDATHRNNEAGYMIGAAVRQAFFLEYGSPNTGAPRPWLTGPANRELEGLAAQLGKEAEPW